MSQRETIGRQRLIIQFLQKRGIATFEEIYDYLELQSEIHDDDYLISKRTFDRDKNDILVLYKIDIQYDFSRGGYYIDSDGQPDANCRIWEAFDTLNALNVKDRVSKYIHFQNRKSGGTEFLHPLLRALKTKKQIRFEYQKFEDEKTSERNLNPYMLKEFRHRWYIVGYDLEDDFVKTYALDRMSELKILNKKFPKPKDFDMNQYYEHFFGVTHIDYKEPETILLSFSPLQGEYIKTLPLHHSQEIIKDDEKELIVQLQLCPTYDFIMELLSIGNKVKVLQPQSLIDEIKEQVKGMLKHYS